MNEKITEAITHLVSKAKVESCDANDALKYTQAALNLAHTLVTFRMVKQD